MMKQSDRLDRDALPAIGRILLMCIFLVPLAGCATISSVLDPQVAAEQLAAKSHFIKEKVPAGIFSLTAYSRLNKYGKSLTVYIEGDGRAWISKNKIADDPTPFHPMMLQLATMDPSPNVVYLGRPCQYDGAASEKPCGPEYWSDKRFSEEVIVSMNEAVNVFAQQSGTGEIHLIGYSGGGAVAVLVAARRNDIASLRTIAGNLDPEGVNTHHRVTAMPGSLDPIEVAPQLSRVPQRHFVGSRDPVVPSWIAGRFVKKLSDGSCAQIIRIDGATHVDGWTKQWAKLVQLPVSCS